MKIELQAIISGVDKISNETIFRENAFSIFVGRKCYGYLYTNLGGWRVALGLPGHNIEYGPVNIKTKEEGIAKAVAIIPHLVGVNPTQIEQHTPDSAEAALYFALKIHDEGHNGMEFLRIWANAEFERIKSMWPDAPENVFGTSEGPDITDERRENE